jgi:AcrR family transcriptional regulator
VRPDRNLEGAEGRSRLLRVAMRQIASLGFDGVTVRSIAAEANVSPGLIKYHFASKEGMREAVDAYFLQRSGAAFDRAIRETQDLDSSKVGEYERAWLVRYGDEWPDFVDYLRRAILENSEWGQGLFRRYFDSIRHSLDRLDVSNRIGAHVDRLWLPYLYAFLLLGPLILDPHIRAILGRSTYEPDMWARFQKAMHSLVWEGASARPPATEKP